MYRHQLMRNDITLVESYQSQHLMEQIFSEEITFADMGLRNSVLRGLTECGFEKPTSIQSQLIPYILAGKDVLGQAKTGTGKTAAFGLPLIHMVDVNIGPQALVLVPTRELAVQISKELRHLANYTPIKVMPIYGGERRHKQIEQLKHNPQIIIGTPGRVMDLHGSRELRFDDICFAVLDEVDRMLDIGFRDDIRKILGNIKQNHQTIFVSATISPEIESLSRKFMNDPEKVISSAGSLTVAQVDQSHFMVQPWDKRRLLLHLLTHEEAALTLVFCSTKREVDRLTEYLVKKEIDVHAIHGDMYQRKRDRVMKKLRGGDLSVLIASDVAARGLDVGGISHVINYDLPFDPEVYVHRIGRTARLGRGGIAWSFITPDDGKYLTAIEALINKEVPLMDYDDFVPGPIPARVQREREHTKAVAEKAASTLSRHTPTKIDKKAAADTTQFPGGIVPVEPPKRRMGGRIRGRRR